MTLALIVRPYYHHRCVSLSSLASVLTSPISDLVEPDKTVDELDEIIEAIRSDTTRMQMIESKESNAHKAVMTQVRRKWQKERERDYKRTGMHREQDWYDGAN